MSNVDNGGGHACMGAEGYMGNLYTSEAGDRWAPGWAALVVPCEQILQDEEEEELSPAQMRDYIFLILEVKETFPTIHEQRGFLEVKKGVMSTYP